MSDLLLQDFNLRKCISTGIAQEMCEKLGYDFDDERVGRIAANMDALVQLGCGGAKSFGDALEVELMLYGDPQKIDRIKPMK